MRWIFPRGLVRSCDAGALEVLAGREVDLPVVAEHDRAAVMARLALVVSCGS